MNIKPVSDVQCFILNNSFFVFISSKGYLLFCRISLHLSAMPMAAFLEVYWQTKILLPTGRSVIAWVIDSFNLKDVP